ncbi:MAG: hypothetical protein GX036_07360 [Firmicutes bacterium]|jgi:hypothetical protein|nr:hypothetical protein [Bacillota bacterium]
MERNEGLARKNIVAVAEAKENTRGKAKPRYTDAENEMIFENWWNPRLRKELSRRFNRKISALRSQFCRILKEKGISNTDYYKIMRNKYQTHTPKELLADDEDQLILEVFAKYQVLGGTRNEACNELQRLLKKKVSEAALKLRFYRLVQKRGLSEEALIKIGRDVLQRAGVRIPEHPVLQGEEVILEATEPVARRTDERPEEIREESSEPVEIPAGKDQAAGEKKTPGLSLVPESSEKKATFLYQLSHLPETVQSLEERVKKLEEAQRHQLDLRGFIEHLLAVERDLKKEEKLLQEIDRLVEENRLLEEKVNQERERLAKRSRELSEIYEILNSMLSEFMHLESVAKLASLGDFIHRLEITVDQFGNVLKSRKV